MRNGRQFYGSVRLLRRCVPPIQNQGPYSCVLPDHFYVNQTLNAYLGEFHSMATIFVWSLMSCIKLCTTVNFAFIHSADHVTFFHSGSGDAGETYSLSCSAILILPGILPTGTPTPTPFSGSLVQMAMPSFPSALLLQQQLPEWPL